jgi:MYXO-CTERM domain-containing protein
LQRTVAIAVDRWVAEEGVTTRGGCAVASGPASLGLWLGVLALAALLRRRRAA